MALFIVNFVIYLALIAVLWVEENFFLVFYSYILALGYFVVEAFICFNYQIYNFPCILIFRCVIIIRDFFLVGFNDYIRKDEIFLLLSFVILVLNVIILFMLGKIRKHSSLQWPHQNSIFYTERPRNRNTPIPKRKIRV